MEVIRDNTYVDIEDFVGSTLSVDGELVSFIATIDGKPQRFCIDPHKAFKMGVWLIAAFKASADMMQIPADKRFTPQVERLMTNNVARTMDVLEKHLKKGMPKPAKKAVPHNVMMPH